MNHSAVLPEPCPVRRLIAKRQRLQNSSAGLDQWLAIQKDPLAWLAGIHRQAPDMARLRIGHKHVWCVFHPEAVHELMVTQRAHLHRWQPSLRILRQWNGSSFMMREGGEAKSQRQIVRPHLQPPAASEIQEIARRWSERIGSGQIFDLDLEMAAYSVTLAGHALFGLNLSNNAETIARAVRILSRVALLETSTGLPLGHWFPSRLCPRKRWALRVMRTQVEAVAAQSQRPLSIHQDDLATLLMAAHQATGATLTWAQLLLARHPKILEALRAELSHVNWSQVTQIHDLRHCPLLRAILQETMRLYPPAYALVPRQLKQPIKLMGRTLSRGDVVMVSSWVTQRDERWFPDPEAFKPERFTNGAQFPQGAYFPFGLGDRACPGTSMAMMDLAVSLAHWVQHWDLEVLQEVTPQGWFSLRAKRAMVRCTLR